MAKKADAEVIEPFTAHDESEQIIPVMQGGLVRSVGEQASNDVTILQGALAAADRRLERMTHFVAELYARQYLLECRLGIRDNGGFKLSALRFTGGQSMGTLELVRDQTIAALKDGL